MSFRTEKPQPRQHCVTLRVSEEQNEILNRLTENLNQSKGEVLRLALDYWLENSPEAKRALRAR